MYHYQIYEVAADLPTDWDILNQDIFLSRAYLAAQEKSLPSNMGCFYVAFYLQERLIAKTCVQRLSLKASEAFRRPPKNWLQAQFRNILKVNLLSVGNMKLTGEHYWEIHKEELNKPELINALEKALGEVRKISKKKKFPIQLITYKDFYQNQLDEFLSHLPPKFHVFSVQPNMVIDLRAHWKDYDAYLADMKTKYRTRAKRAFKKFEGIEVRELSTNEIEQYNAQIYALYKHVSEEASFNTYVLPPNYILQMKVELGDRFRVFGCFLEDEMVSFYTLFHNHSVLETGFLGYDAQYLNSKQLYLSMLYLMIKYGIEHGFSQIVFSRTALEIKSSVGAVPYEMFGLIRHTSPILNCAMKFFFQFMKPQTEWQPRHPFKE